MFYIYGNAIYDPYFTNKWIAGKLEHYSLR